ncbi:MAG: hypothetical protein ACO4CZ_10195, partial [Planctomycetota bacterium]
MNRYSLLRSGNSALVIALSTLAAACTPQAADEAATADVATAESEAPSAEWRQLAANGEGEVVFIVDGES